MSYTPKSDKQIEIIKEIIAPSPVEKQIRFLTSALEKTLENIVFLESIYVTGGENRHYSEEFSDAAHRERQDMCKLSSWLYSQLRELGVDDKTLPNSHKMSVTTTITINS